MKIQQAEYIWLDGALPLQKLRAKTRIIAMAEDAPATLASFPAWTFDGSSTYQATGRESDLQLQPIRFVKDPLRCAGNFLVLCEVLNADGTPHTTNSRAALRGILDSGAAAEEPWIGFEQEYTLMKCGTPLGFPAEGFPAPQGPYYCGVGADAVFGRPIIEVHTRACLDAGIMIYGVNAEVMPGQWEFQIGHRGIEGESADPLTVSDHLWLARWLLLRIGESFNVQPSLAAKPVPGDWNGSGLHTNFSTRGTRDRISGMAEITLAIQALRRKHHEHLAVYGEGLAERLTGSHETCAIDEFRDGVADRGASIRIPLHVAAQGHGYLEDRRPAANADPYRVAERLLKTICHSAPKAAAQAAAAGTGKTARRGLWKTGGLALWEQPADESHAGFIGE